MTDRIFEMLKKDNTRYVVNKEKQYELERLTTFTQLALTNVLISKHHRKLLDMQCLLLTVQTLAFSLKQEAVTVAEIIEYCKKHYVPALAQSRKLIITAIVNGYLEETKNRHKTSKK